MQIAWYVWNGYQFESAKFFKIHQDEMDYTYVECIMTSHYHNISLLSYFCAFSTVLLFVVDTDIEGLI